MKEQIVLVWRRFPPDSINNSKSPFDEIIKRFVSQGFTVEHQLSDGESSLIVKLQK